MFSSMIETGQKLMRKGSCQGLGVDNGNDRQSGAHDLLFASMANGSEF